MKTISHNVVGVIHLRGWPANGDLANQLAAIIYGHGGQRSTPCRNDRFVLDDHSVLAETTHLRHELESLYSATISRW
jgi:hypothetical protein